MLSNPILVCSADEFGREQLSDIPLTDDDEKPIEPVSDIGIDQINVIMFNNMIVNPASGIVHFNEIVLSWRDFVSGPHSLAFIIDMLCALAHRNMV